MSGIKLAMKAEGMWFTFTPSAETIRKFELGEEEEVSVVKVTDLTRTYAKIMNAPIKATFPDGSDVVSFP